MMVLNNVYETLSTGMLIKERDYLGVAWRITCCSYGIVCLCAKSLQSCPTLWDPVDCSLSGSSVRGILQAWSGLPCLPPGDLPDPGIETASPVASAS